MKTTQIVACLALVACSLASAQTAPTAPPAAPPEGAPRDITGGGQFEGRAPRAGGRAGGAQSFEAAMKRTERGFDVLEESAFDAASKTKDLESIQGVQAGLVAAKGMCSTVKMTAAAKAKYGEDNAKFVLDMRTQLIAALQDAIALEQAVLANNQAAAKAAFDKLHNQEHASHDVFRPADDEKKSDAPAKPAPKN